MILWYCVPGHPLLNQNPGCHGITAETTQLLSHPTLEGCLGSGSPVPAQHLLHRAETWSVSHLWPREWDEHHGTLRCASTCPGLTDGSGQGGTTWHLATTGHWCHICHTPATAGLSGELLGILESHELCMGTVFHWWRVNHHVPEQSQGLDLDGIPWQDVCRFFLSAMFASRPSRTVLSWEHQLHCRVFLEVFTFTVAGFRDSASIL